MTNRDAQSFLRELIQTGGLVASEHIDPIAISASLGFDPEQVLVATANLEALGLLERVENTRTYKVRHPTPEELMRYMNIRLDIETRVASTLALTATESDIEVLRRASDVQRHIAHRNEAIRFLEESARFHQLLATMANFLHGARVLRTWEDYQLIIGMRAIEERDSMMHAVHEHETLLRYIEAHETELAAQSMKSHLEKTFERMKVALAA